MNPNQKQLKLKKQWEKLGYKVYLEPTRVRVFWPGHEGSVYTYRQAYSLVKGKSLRPYGKRLKADQRIIRTKVRDQIKTHSEDVGYPRKLASDPWCYT